MWHKFWNSIRRNLFWIILLSVFLIPQIRNPLQVLLNRGFSYVNRVTVKEERENVKLEELAFEDEFGNVINASQLEGEVIFINFWATWCPPCVAEMPSIQELYNDYGSKVEFLLISNEPFDRTSKFKSKKGYTFKVVRPKSIPETVYGRSIPRTLILDRKGNIVVEKSGSVDWNSTKVRRLLDDLMNEAI